jgi:hypothetical protein
MVKFMTDLCPVVLNMGPWSLTSISKQYLKGHWTIANKWGGTKKLYTEAEGDPWVSRIALQFIRIQSR